MSNNTRLTPAQQNMKDIRSLITGDNVKKKFSEMIGKKAPGFITSVMQVVSNNQLLQKATPESIYGCAAMAAALDLPINNSLGFAWIVPYGNQAQFQIGWKGLVQLAQRSGQYKRINVVPVYENQFKSYDRLSEDLDADFTLEGTGKIVGYVAYFQLINGFEKLSFWTTEEVHKHAKRFSKTYNSSSSVWKTDEPAMCMKTVLKNVIAKWGPMSIEMQHAVIADQAVIKDAETMDVEYVDEGSSESAKSLPTLTDKEVADAINDGMTREQIQGTYQLTEEQTKLFGNE